MLLDDLSFLYDCLDNSLMILIYNKTINIYCELLHLINGYSNQWIKKYLYLLSSSVLFFIDATAFNNLKYSLSKITLVLHNCTYSTDLSTLSSKIVDAPKLWRSWS